MRLPRFTCFEPKSLAEALTLLSAHPDALVKAGGTDLLPRLKRRLAEPKCLISLKGLSDLDFIRRGDEGDLHIGALTALRHIETSVLVRERFSALAEAAAKVASIEIRNMATLGGNICQDTRCEFYNQSPLFRRGTDPCVKAGGTKCFMSRRGNQCHALLGSDTAPLLVASDATLSVVSRDGEQRVSMESFYTGDGKTPHVLPRDRIVAEIQIPRAVTEKRAAYLKYRFREGVDFPLVGVAVLGDRARKAGQSKGVRIVVGGATSKPFRCVEAEALLDDGEKADPLFLDKVGDTAAHEMPITSHSGCPVSHRRTLVKQLVIRGIQMALG